MQIICVSNFMSHHQIAVSDELYRLTHGNYFFVETSRLPESFKKNSGFVDFERNYIIRAWASEANRRKAIELAQVADVVIGSDGKGSIPYIKDRLKMNKLTFDCSERPLKKGWINFFSPTNLITQLYYHLFFYNKPYYKLCSSAYCAKDLYLMHSFIGRCFKYGYFPIIENIDVDRIIESKQNHAKIRIIWCARFIKWKHPELVVLLGKELRERGYDYEINMIGKGKLWTKIYNMIRSESLENYIHLVGAISNNKVLQMMREHDIFLFTSDKNEGWGVVLNEAMGQACCPVVSNQIGATPYLLEHKKNGIIFESGNLASLVDGITYLIEKPEDRMAMSKSAYFQVKKLWSPEIAAERLYKIMESLCINQTIEYSDGPLSIAVPIDSNDLIKDL